MDGASPIVRNEANGKTTDFPWGRISWLADRDLTGAGCGLTFGIVTIGASERNMGHVHRECDELIYVERGRIRHSLGSRSVELGPGDLLHVPRGIPHDAVNIGDEEVRLVVVYDTAARDIEPCDLPPPCPADRE